MHQINVASDGIHVVNCQLEDWRGKSHCVQTLATCMYSNSNIMHMLYSCTLYTVTLSKMVEGEGSTHQESEGVFEIRTFEHALNIEYVGMCIFQYIQR